MSNYIGNQPAFGEFKKLDSIVSLFNGSTTQFNLEYNSVGHTIGDATQLIVSLNGVVQEPGTAYTLGIGGGSIVFASAPASTDTCHIVLLGGVGGTTTPTDGSVTASKLDPNLKDYLEETFTADGTQTVFTLTRAVVGANSLLVTIDGIVQPSGAFTASGTTLTISEVLAATTNVRVVHMGVKAGVYVPADDSVTPDMLANSINTDIASKLPLAGGTMTGVIAGFTSTGIDDNATSTAITIDGSENVGIGTNSPAARATIKTASNEEDALLIEQSDGTDVGSLRINNGSFILKGKSASQPVQIQTFDGNEDIEVDPDGFIKFETAGSEAMRIDSSGNVLVGTTSTGAATASNGAYITPDGQIIGRSNGIVSYLNRRSTDGQILQFMKDGTTVGSIFSGHGGTQVGIGTNTTGITFNPATRSMMPANPSSTSPQLDATLDIGFPSVRWKDAYLSGGVYLGGTGAANKLDDYEEGTWTPSISVETVGAAGITVNHATYTKIGRLVSLVFDVTINSVTGTSSSRAIQLEGMPFIINTTGAIGGGPNIGYTNLTNSMSGNLALQGRFNTRYRIVNLNGATAQNASDHIQASTVLRGQFTYHTDQ